MSFRQLTKVTLTAPADLAEFRKCFFTYSNTEVPVSYLETVTVQGFFDSQGKLRAGYCVATGRKTRSFAILEAVDKSTILRSIPDLEEIAEVSCLWIDPSVSTQIGRLQIYFATLLDFHATGKPFGLACTRRHQLQRDYRLAFPHVVFRGEVHTALFNGPWWVLYGTRETVTLGFFRFALTRIFRFRKRRTDKPVSQQVDDHVWNRGNSSTEFKAPTDR